MKTILVFAMLMIVLMPGKSYATCSTCSCGATSLGVSFGNYTASSVDQSTGTIIVTCSNTGLPASVSYTLGLSAGNGSFSNRQLVYATTNKLNYNLYTTLGYANIWGDGTSGTSTVSDSYTVTVSGIKNYTIYGRIPASQNVAAGTSYKDTITVTVTY